MERIAREVLKNESCYIFIDNKICIKLEEIFVAVILKKCS